jgi:TetR/AcrR family transcriptional repressor of nem operon
MGRPREFDVTEALERALFVFWRQGYGGTAIPDLEKAMGIGRTSIYSAFGDKEALFLAALDLYAERYMRPHLDALAVASDVRAAIRSHFAALLAFLTNPQLPPGCLLTNMATECDRGASTIGRKLAALIGRNEAAFYQALRGAQARGEIGADTDVRSVARYFAMAVQGLSVMAKAYVDPAVLDDVVRQVFASVDGLLGAARPPSEASSVDARRVEPSARSGRRSQI